jgi:uncharacterized membrane protein
MMPTAMAATSTGLAPRTAATLAYSAWWITGLIFWALERQDRFVRFHAAQAMTAFGAVAMMVVLFGGLAAASLSFLPTAFTPLLTAAFVTWLGGLGLWVVAMWKAASGEAFRIPLAADWADRLNRD